VWSRSFDPSSYRVRPLQEDTHQNMTKPGTRPITSKMQTSQSGTSTPATPTSPTSIQLEEQGNRDILVSLSSNQDVVPPQPPQTSTPQENWGTIGLPEMRPTSPPYRSPSAWEKAEQKQKEHDRLHWTGCYNDNCWVHDSEKVVQGGYPKKSNATQSGWQQPSETMAPAPAKDQKVQMSKNQERENRHATKNWKEYHNDECPPHV